MATKQGWKDFNTIISRMKICIDNILELSNQIQRLEKNKDDIIDDAVRLADIKEILDIHPDYSVNWVQQRITKLSELKTWLEDNNYL